MTACGAVFPTGGGRRARAAAAAGAASGRAFRRLGA